VLERPGRDVGAVHGGHYARIEDVHVQMDPVAVEVSTVGDIQDPGRGLLQTLMPDL
jgi:hypothetical protein